MTYKQVPPLEQVVEVQPLVCRFCRLCLNPKPLFFSNKHTVISKKKYIGLNIFYKKIRFFLICL
jgi:hypothetical protein